MVSFVTDWRPLHIFILVFSANFLLDHHGFNVNSIYMSIAVAEGGMQHIESSVRPGACLPCLSVCLVCLLCLSHLTDITRMSRIAVGATATAVANHVIPTSARHSRTCARRRSNEPPQHSTAHECLSYHRLILHHQSIYSPLQLYYIHFLHGCFIQDATTQAHAAPKQHERNVRIIHPPK